MEVGDSQWDTLVEKVLSGLPIVYPTPNLPALGCLTTTAALDELFRIKNRSPEMVVSLAVADVEQAKEIVDVPEQAKQLLSDFPTGSITLILSAKKTMDARVGGEKVAIRVISTEISQQLLRTVGPLTATSANVSGIAPVSNCLVAARALGLNEKQCLSGYCSGEPPSTLIRCNDYAALVSGKQLEVLREGCISKEEVNAWSMKMI
jgi:L-threonylcarbamoyladenylate synthase